MTISEASQLVIQSASMAKSGDLFVLDMGRPVKISDLAERMVELSGKSVKSVNNPRGDIEIKVVRLRPGEKLYELLIGNTRNHTKHPRIFKTREQHFHLEDLEPLLKRLKKKSTKGIFTILESSHKASSRIPTQQKND